MHYNSFLHKRFVELKYNQRTQRSLEFRKKRGGGGGGFGQRPPQIRDLDRLKCARQNVSDIHM